MDIILKDTIDYTYTTVKQFRDLLDSSTVSTFDHCEIFMLFTCFRRCSGYDADVTQGQFSVGQFDRGHMVGTMREQLDEDDNCYDEDAYTDQFDIIKIQKKDETIYDYYGWPEDNQCGFFATIHNKDGLLTLSAYDNNDGDFNNPELSRYGKIRMHPQLVIAIVYLEKNIPTAIIPTILMYFITDKWIGFHAMEYFNVSTCQYQ